LTDKLAALTIAISRLAASARQLYMSSLTYHGARSSDIDMPGEGEGVKHPWPLLIWACILKTTGHLGGGKRKKGKKEGPENLG
jgi:hypothetical protein